jgi:hypothetical protein
MKLGKGVCICRTRRCRKGRGVKIISKYSPKQFPSLPDARRHRTESLHPVPARLAVTSQSTSHKGSSQLPARLKVTSQSTAHKGSSQLPPGSRSPARVLLTRVACNSRQARGHQPEHPSLAARSYQLETLPSWYWESGS